MPARLAIGPGMTVPPPPQITRVTTARVACDGAHDGIPTALGHPRVYLQIDEHGYVDCGYCDRRFILVGSAADVAESGGPADVAAGASH